jgi:hypothetical protein
MNTVVAAAPVRRRTRIEVRDIRSETAAMGPVPRASALSAELAALPFGPEDATAGAENELLTVVTGTRDQVDLARAVAESNYFKNLARRAGAGDASKTLVRDIEDYLSENRENVWENSWVYFPADLMTPYARDVFEGDLYADKRRAAHRSFTNAMVAEETTTSTEPMLWTIAPIIGVR